ncbi:MAG: hypothetical protein DI539_23085 [Flavobacterium psychrophilum]|nr:MAG: hypothetical protein DI539_23085 [Flavobacterium psychrophilum]
MSKLLNLSDNLNFYLCRRPVKMSRSFDSLAALIRTEMGKGIITGGVFIFLNKPRTTVKIFIYESGEFSIFYRLDEGSFQVLLVKTDPLNYKMTAGQLSWMLSGVTLSEDGYLNQEKYVPLHGSI